MNRWCSTTSRNHVLAGSKNVYPFEKPCRQSMSIAGRFDDYRITAHCINSLRIYLRDLKLRTSGVDIP